MIYIYTSVNLCISMHSMCIEQRIQRKKVWWTRIYCFRTVYPIVYLNIMYLSKRCDFSESVLKPRACVPEHGLGILRSASKAAFYICMPTDTQGLTEASKGPQRQQSSTEAQQRPNRSPAEAHSSPQSPSRGPGMQSICFYVFSRVCDLYMFSRAKVK